jgi:hypothetical protein
MGNFQAMTIADITESEMSLEQQLRWHLTSNHYPSVPTIMVEVCKKAIEMYHNGDDMTTLIDLPAGVKWREQSQVPAIEVCESFHLDAWTYSYDYDAYNDSKESE